MTRFARLAFLPLLAPMLALAENWSGVLVDSKCYAGTQRNVNPRENSSVGSDTSRAIRFCSPGAKTKLFAVVQRDGFAFNLDSIGNKKASELLLKAGKKSLYIVTVTGERSGDKVRADAISVAK